MSRGGEERNDEHPSRRTAFKIALAVGGVAGLASLGLCFRDRFSGSEDGPSSLPFDVWRAIRDALRKSPDHLVARADALVAGKDADAIFRFVRDEVATYPTSDLSFTGHNTTFARWGARATLRCGAGTPREKADLLAELLTRAGHEAEVVEIPHALDEDAVRKLLVAPERSFAPAVDEDELRSWRKLLGLEAAGTAVPSFDVGGKDAEAAVDRYLKVLPTETALRWERARPFALGWRGQVASVRFKDASGQRLLTPLPGEEPRAEDDKTRGRPTRDATGIIEVEVALQAATTVDPKDRFELVRGKWTADQIVGRQVVVLTLPACHPENWSLTRFCDVHTFVPILAVQDPQRAKEPGQDTLIVGQAISAEGERIEIAADGSLIIGENVLSPSASTRAADVAKLEVEAQADAFPRIDLKATAYDKSGSKVEGLSAKDFAVFDDDKPVAHMLLADRESPRVAVLIDASGSMPGEYLGRRMDEFYAGLEGVLRSVSPHAILLRRPTDSNLWKNLADASVDMPAFIVYVTDGHVYDAATPEILARLASGPKALLIGVREGQEDVLQAMADATKGRFVRATNTEETQRAIAEMLRGHSEPSYRLRYVATHRDPGRHTARMTVPAGKSEASAPYDVPKQPQRPPQLVGLYLSVKVGGTEHVSTLAGHDHRIPHLPFQVEALADVRAAMFGTTVVAIEAAAPPTSVWLDDLLTARLSIEPVHKELVQGDGHAARAALHEHFRYLPADLCQTVMLDLPRLGQSAMTYQTGLRVGIYQERAAFDRRGVRRQVGLLPSAGFVTAEPDVDTACTLTARRTARFSVAQRARFDESALSILEGEALALLDSRSPIFGEIELDARRHWFELMRGVATSNWIVGPEDATPMSYLRINKLTGETSAVLVDGACGGRSLVPTAFGLDEMMTLPNHLSMRCAQAGGSVALGMIEDLEAFLSGHARAVTVVSQLVDSALDLREPMQHFSCTAIEEVLFGPTGVAEDDRSIVDPLLALLRGGAPSACLGKIE